MIADASAVAGLKRLLQPAVACVPEACDLCGVAVADQHSHVVDLEGRALVCVCRPCGLLFASDGAAGGRYKLVPERYLRLGAAGAVAWDLLDVPVGVAFCFFNSTLGRVALMYPGPAGATESQVPLDAWTDVVSAHPVLATLVPDVEALLVRRSLSEHASYVVPIDVCYELVGLMRRHWRGFDGGEEARRHLDEFFTRIGDRASTLSPRDMP